MSDEDILLFPSPGGDDANYVELSNGSEYRTLRKKILPMNGSFIHPASPKTKIFVDKQMAESLVKNFKRLDFPVQVPIVNDANQHVEDPLRNAGVVKAVDYDDTGVYATIEARKYADDFGKTILGASAFLHLNYVDTATGERIGPTLLHVAATNRPHINGLGDFEDMLKASADISDEQQILVMEAETGEPKTPVEENPPVEESIQSKVTDEDGQMTTEEMLAALKGEGYDFDALTARVSELEGKATEAAELSAQLDAANEQLRLSAGAAVSSDDLAGAILELSNNNKSLVEDVEALKLSNATYVKREAEHEVDELVKVGRVLPAQRDAMVELSLSNREMFDKIVPDTALVSLSESGVTTHDEATRSEDHVSKVSDYASRAKNAR